MKSLGVLRVFVLVASCASAQVSAIDRTLAKNYFREAQAASEKDAGKLWHTQLYGPILFVDPETRAVVANQADNEGRLKREDDVLVGNLPPEIGVANTSTRWGGVEWTMVVWPLPEYRQARVRLLLHECFHRIQGSIGLPATDSANNHLDTRDGRVWLQLEWRALEHALWQQSEDRRKAIEDALYFRSFRRSLFSGAATREDGLELNEGLAEYTGMKLSTQSHAEFAMAVDADLREAPVRRPGFVRSFAYVSGPAYGWLLDAAGTDWRQSLTAQSDLGKVLATAYAVKLPPPTRAGAVERAAAYGGDEVIAIETQRDEERQARLAAAKRQFIDGPVLLLPLSQDVGYTFDPHGIFAIDDTSSVYYGQVEITDHWGIAKCSKGVLLTRDAAGGVVRAQLPLPADTSKHPLAGDGWTLELNGGWAVAPAKRAGDLTLISQGNP
jgi:hypothetical protein